MAKFLDRLRNLPENEKKLIVWGATILLGIGLLALWLPRMSERLKVPQGPSLEEQFSIPQLQEQLQNIPVQINGEQ